MAAIQSLLISHHSIIVTQICGKGYGGASYMKGEITLIMKESPSAYYIDIVLLMTNKLFFSLSPH